MDFLQFDFSPLTRAVIFKPVSEFLQIESPVAEAKVSSKSTALVSVDKGNAPR